MTVRVLRFGSVFATALFLAVMATVALGDPPHPASGVDGTHNCDDFASAAEAQDYFVQTGGNNGPEEDLDRDDDGRACEWNGAPWVPDSDPPDDAPDANGVPAPSRVDAGGGYCAVSDEC